MTKGDFFNTCLPRGTWNNFYVHYICTLFCGAYNIYSLIRLYKSWPEYDMLDNNRADCYSNLHLLGLFGSSKKGVNPSSTCRKHPFQMMPISLESWLVQRKSKHKLVWWCVGYSVQNDRCVCARLCAKKWLVWWVVVLCGRQAQSSRWHFTLFPLEEATAMKTS